MKGWKVERVRVAVLQDDGSQVCVCACVYVRVRMYVHVHVYSSRVPGPCYGVWGPPNQVVEVIAVIQWTPELSLVAN